MSEQQHTLTPFERVGPYRFGASADECAQVLAPHDRAWESRPMRQQYEQRGAVQATYQQGTLVEVTFTEGATLIAADVDVFGDPNAVEKLRAADAGATEQKQWVNLPSLGLCLGGFGKRKLKEGRTAIAYARSQSVSITFLGKV